MSYRYLGFHKEKVFHNYFQYRTINHTYLFERTAKDVLNLKVYNLSQNCIFDKTFSDRDLQVHNWTVHQLFDKRKPVEFLTTVGVDQRAFPFVTHDQRLEMFNNIINNFKTQHPECGFSLVFEKDNSSIANSALILAEECMKQGEYDDALKIYEMASKYTKNFDHCYRIVSFFEDEKEENKAALVYLYLVFQQFKNGQVKDAINTLVDKYTFLIEKEPEVKGLLINLYQELLMKDPRNMEVYEKLPSLLEDAERVQCMFKKTCHVLEVSSFKYTHDFFTLAADLRVELEIKATFLDEYLYCCIWAESEEEKDIGNVISNLSDDLKVGPMKKLKDEIYRGYDNSKLNSIIKVYGEWRRRCKGTSRKRILGNFTKRN